MHIILLICVNFWIRNTAKLYNYKENKTTKKLCFLLLAIANRVGDIQKAHAYCVCMAMVCSLALAQYDAYVYTVTSTTLPNKLNPTDSVVMTHLQGQPTPPLWQMGNPYPIQRHTCTSTFLRVRNSSSLHPRSVHKLAR